MKNCKLKLNIQFTIVISRRCSCKDSNFASLSRITLFPVLLMIHVDSKKYFLIQILQKVISSQKKSLKYSLQLLLMLRNLLRRAFIASLFILSSMKQLHHKLRNNAKFIHSTGLNCMTRFLVWLIVC